MWSEWKRPHMDKKGELMHGNDTKKMRYTDVETDRQTDGKAKVIAKPFFIANFIWVMIMCIVWRIAYKYNIVLDTLEYNVITP